MGRAKLKIKRLENASGRHVTFSKRKTGIIKKAKELSILCDIDLALLMFSPAEKAILCLGENSTIDQVLHKFSQQTPQERAKRLYFYPILIIEFLIYQTMMKVLKKTFKKLDHDVNIQDFVGSSFWVKPESVEKLEHIIGIEDYLKHALNDLDAQKEMCDRINFANMEGSSSNRFQGGMQSMHMTAQPPMPWIHNNAQHTMLNAQHTNKLPNVISHNLPLAAQNDTHVPRPVQNNTPLDHKDTSRYNIYPTNMEGSSSNQFQGGMQSMHMAAQPPMPWIQNNAQHTILNVQHIMQLPNVTNHNFPLAAQNDTHVPRPMQNNTPFDHKDTSRYNIDPANMNGSSSNLFQGGMQSIHMAAQPPMSWIQNNAPHTMINAQHNMLLPNVTNHNFPLIAQNDTHVPRPMQNNTPRPLQNNTPRPMQNNTPRPMQNNTHRPMQNNTPLDHKDTSRYNIDPVNFSDFFEINTQDYQLDGSSQDETAVMNLNEMDRHHRSMNMQQQLGGSQHSYQPSSSST
ncbi:hypothetical protein ZOSMA_36G00050 [Zostera marina]|uniref:MADS-box domain-containing protein n=1 Tax=Zostera marina TaxID=29655 RepID=A0A0K9P5W1_ZOSMR|nr:hypothetical protein ZOSMA_36G00050 [Zostera marina]